MNGPLQPVILFAALILAAAALIFLTRKHGLPEGKVIYEDLIRGETPSKTMFSEKYGLSGKPDMVIRQGKDLIPVEIKHAPAGDHPRPSHVLQLAAYCLLVEETYGIRPSRGIIRYRDRLFEVPFTGGLEKDLLKTMAAMRAEDPQAGLPPGCSGHGKCAHCGFAKICAGGAGVDTSKT